MRRSLAGVILAAAMLTTPAAILGAAPGSTTSAAPTEPFTALLNKYCVTCHSEKTHTAGLVLEKRDLSAVAQDPQIWEKVVRKLHAGSMPPMGLPRPDNADVDRFTGWLEATLDHAAAEHPNP